MEDPFFNLIPRALSYLYREGKTGHWVDARSTSYVSLALLRSGESFQSPHLTSSAAYLCSAFREEAKGGSWGSEVWDTALAVRVLEKLPVNKEAITDKAFDWIWSKRLEDGSFDGEPWDTLYVALAALEAGKLDEIIPTLEWLLSRQTDSGVFISNHYTGLFCDILGSALELRSIPTSLHQKLQQAAIKALAYLWDEYDPNRLWGGSSWTNAFIISGMLSMHHPQIISKYDEILAWYSQRQSASGAWEDIVRTAIVTDALWKLKLACDLERVYRKQLQTLTMEFFTRSTEEQLIKTVSLRTIKVPVVTAGKLIARDEGGNWLVTLTPERQAYLGAAVACISALWAVITNWSSIVRLLFR